MDILVYGAGAIGGYLGGRLALAGHRVTLVLREEAATLISVHGLSITQEGKTEVAPVQAVTTLQDAFGAGKAYDLIILGMKSYDLEPALQELANVCPAPPLLLSTQNGIGIEELIAGRFGAEHVLAGTVTIPVSRAGPNELVVERAGRGLGIAPVFPEESSERWVDIFTTAGVRTGARADYRAMKWSKAFLNIMGNASSAILGRPPAELYRRADIFDLEMRMLRETLEVMKRLGLAITNLPGASVKPLARTLRYAPRFLQRIVFTQVIMHGRGDKLPSFHMDMAAGKKRSEVEFHNGAIAAAGRANEVPTPVNATVNAVLLQLTRGEVDRALYEARPDRLLAEVARHELLGP